MRRRRHDRALHFAPSTSLRMTRVEWRTYLNDRSASRPISQQALIKDGFEGRLRRRAARDLDDENLHLAEARVVHPVGRLREPQCRLALEHDRERSALPILASGAERTCLHQGEHNGRSSMQANFKFLVQAGRELRDAHFVEFKHAARLPDSGRVRQEILEPGPRISIYTTTIGEKYK